MGSPSTGTIVQTTMSLARGKHQQSLSAGASLQLENARSAEELSSGAAMSPRATEEQSLAVKKRTQSSQGLELSDGASGAEERKPLSFISVGRHRRGGSGSGSPRAKGIMCSSPGAGKSALAKMAATALHSPTKLERSLSLSRVAHRVVPDVDGSSPRSRTGAREATLPEMKQQDVQRELESRLQTVAAHKSENGFSTSEKKVESNNGHTNAVPLSCSGSGALLAVKAGGEGEDENSHPGTAEVASHGLLGSTEDGGEYLCSSGAHLPVKDIHPVCFETTNKLRAEQARTVSMNTSHDLLPETARSCSPSAAAASTQEEPHLSNCNGRQFAACEPQSEDLSNGTRTENSHRISHPNVLPTSNLSPAALDLSYQDIKEVTPPRTSGAVCNQESEVEKNAHPTYSSDLTKAAILSSIACEKNSPEESKQGAMDASQGKDVREFHFSAEKVGLRKVNGSEACLRKNTSFEQGEKKTKIRKRRRSVSASGIGAILLKIVRTSEPEHIGARSLPRAESEVAEANPLLATANLPQDAQFETEPTDVEAVDMDVEYEDCSSELAAAADTEFSENKDASSEEVKLQIVDETHLKTVREEGPALHDSKKEEPLAGSFNNECDKRVISSGNCNPHSDSERFLDARDKSLDRNNSFESIEPSSPVGKPPKEEAAVKENGFGGSQRRRRHGSRGRMSHDLDSSTVAIDENRRSLSLVDENLCMITSLQRSRSFASMLQVSPRQSVDESAQAHLAPSSIAILTNPSFSSSHQDRLWEEQAEYSSGGRGTPGRDDDDETHTPSPSGAMSSDDAVRSAAASLRKSHERDISSLSCSGFASDSGRSIKLGQSGKKRGRPQRSPLRSLLDAEDDEPPATPRPSERHHFLKQILSRIRGKSCSSKSSPHKPSSQTTPRRRNSIIWSSCMCFSHVN